MNSSSPLAGGASQPVHRVKSMFGQSTGKLPPPRLPAHPPPPQRSISHSEVSKLNYPFKLIFPLSIMYPFRRECDLILMGVE